MGGLKQEPVDDAIRDAEEKQEKEREREAYKKGKKRREKIQGDPAAGGSPQEDGYGSMTDREKKEYKRGYRGG